MRDVGLALVVLVVLLLLRPQGITGGREFGLPNLPWRRRRDPDPSPPQPAPTEAEPNPKELKA